MIKNLWFRGLSRVKICRRLILRERPSGQPFPSVSTRMPVRVSMLAATEIGAFLAFRLSEHAGEIRRRSDEGQWCFVAWHDRQIIHAAWAVPGRARIEYLSMEIMLAPDELYAYDVFTSPAFRGLGVSPTRMLEMMRYFRDHGYRRLIAAISPENRPAFRPGERVGWDRRIGKIG